MNKEGFWGYVKQYEPEPVQKAPVNLFIKYLTTMYQILTMTFLFKFS